MNNRSVILRGREDIFWFFNNKRRRQFEFAFENMDSMQTQEWLETIRRDYFACGCEIGSLFLISALVILAIFFSIGWMEELPLFRLTNALYSFGFMFIMAGIGKITGLIIAKHRLQKNLVRLAAII